MTKPTTTSRATTLRVAIIAVAILLALVASYLVFLILTRDAPVALPSPDASKTPAPLRSDPPPSASAPLTTDQPPTGGDDPTPIESATEPTTDPSSSEAPAQTPPPRPAAAPSTTMAWQGLATFENFSVELPPLEGDPPEIDGKAGFFVEVCALKELSSDQVRISSEPWSFADAEGNVGRPTEGGYEPAFPTSTTVAVGECVSGYLTFDFLPGESDYLNLIYQNGLGDRAVWQFH